MKIKAKTEASIVTAIAEDGNSYPIQNAFKDFKGGYIKLAELSIPIKEGDILNFSLENGMLIYEIEFPESNISS